MSRVRDTQTRKKAPITASGLVTVWQSGLDRDSSLNSFDRAAVVVTLPHYHTLGLSTATEPTLIYNINCARYVSDTTCNGMIWLDRLYATVWTVVVTCLATEVVTNNFQHTNRHKHMTTFWRYHILETWTSRHYRLLFSGNSNFNLDSSKVLPEH